jgi:hypothetical protein
VPEGAVSCVSCGVAVNSSAASMSASQPTVPSREFPASPNTPSDGEMSARLAKALRRTELLSYAVAGLGVAILVVIIGIAFLQ